jgi:Cys-tRNA(Pro) deacylase
MLEQYHPTVNQIIELLKENDAWYETFEHDPVTTSEQAAKIRTGYTLDQGAKALILSVKKSKTQKSFVQVVVPGSAKLNSKLITKFLEAKSIRFANAEEIEQLTKGIQIGGIPPFGNLFDIPVYIDNSLTKFEKIIFNAGDRSFSIGMKTKDYLEIVKPTIDIFIQ